MITIGKTWSLPVIKLSDFGAYLDAQNLGKAFLHRSMVPQGLKVGDELSVFLYVDSDETLVATTKKPKCEVGQFAFLEAVSTSKVGAFLDNGLSKDVLLPFGEQHRRIEVGRSYIVYLYLDKKDGRITASSKIDKFLKDERPHDFKARQPVELLIANSTDLGYKAIIDNSHWGVLYKSDVFQRLSFGQRVRGFIKHVRPDGKLDLTLQGGQETRDKQSQIILNHLKKQGGFAPVHDKSDPKLIRDLFGMSKGAFKKAVGGLYKQRVIAIEDDGIRLLEQD